MAKAIRQVKRVAAARKPRAPFKLTAEASAILQAHAELQGAEDAVAASIRADGEGKPNSPKTERLLRDRDRKRTRVARIGRDAVERLRRVHSKRRATLPEILTISVAAWNTDSVSHALLGAVYSASGIDMRAVA